MQVGVNFFRIEMETRVTLLYHKGDPLLWCSYEQGSSRFRDWLSFHRRDWLISRSRGSHRVTPGESRSLFRIPTWHCYFWGPGFIGSSALYMAPILCLGRLPRRKGFTRSWEKVLQVHCGWRLGCHRSSLIPSSKGSYVGRCIWQSQAFICLLSQSFQLGRKKGRDDMLLAQSRLGSRIPINRLGAWLTIFLFDGLVSPSPL